MKNILLHTLDAEDRMVNYVILGRVKEWVSRRSDEFENIDSIRKRANEVESKTSTYVARITPAELERKVEVSRVGMLPASVSSGRHFDSRGLRDCASLRQADCAVVAD